MSTAAPLLFALVRIFAFVRAGDMVRFTKLVSQKKLSQRRASTVNEPEKQTTPVSVIALRAESWSADGDSVVISLRTKYSTAERKYSVPRNCLQDLILDLKRLTSGP